MDPLFKALANMPPPRKKRHLVTIEGKEMEVSLEKKLEIIRAGEYAFTLKDGHILRKPKQKTKVDCKILVKSDTGGHFYDGDPYWINKIAEGGHQWQIKSE